MNYFFLKNGVGSASHSKEEYRVTEKYFGMVTEALILRLRDHEEAVKQEGENLSSYIFAFPAMQRWIWL